MGWLFKDRHGTMRTLMAGRQFIWEIPKIASYVDTVLDGENVEAFTGAKFHFHMTVSKTQDFGVYLHYKSPPIPKYSYYFAAKETQHASTTTSEGEKANTWISPNGVSSTRVSRQFTAHTIPADTERCGHWNVFNKSQLDELLAGTDGTLLVVFEFDDDIVKVEGLDVTRVTWTIPRFRFRHCQPLSSRGFVINGQLFVLRLDQKSGHSGDFVGFAFSKTPVPPPQSLVMATVDGIILGQVERSPEGEPQAPMVAKRDAVLAHLGPGATLIVTLTVFKVANPLEQLNAALKAGLSIGGPNAGNAPAPKTADVGSDQYIVFQDDL